MAAPPPRTDGSRNEKPCLLQSSLLIRLPSKDLHRCGHQELGSLTPEATLIPWYSFLFPSPFCGAWHAWSQATELEIGALSSTTPSSSLPYSINDQLRSILPSQPSQSTVFSSPFPAPRLHAGQYLLPRWPSSLFAGLPTSGLTHPICLLREVSKNKSHRVIARLRSSSGFPWILE